MTTGTRPTNRPTEHTHVRMLHVFAPITDHTYVYESSFSILSRSRDTAKCRYDCWKDPPPIRPRSCHAFGLHLSASLRVDARHFDRSVSARVDEEQEREQECQGDLDHMTHADRGTCCCSFNRLDGKPFTEGTCYRSHSRALHKACPLAAASNVTWMPCIGR